MRVAGHQLAVLLLLARPVAAQMRIEPFAPRLSPAPAVALSPASLPAASIAPSLLSPAPLPASALPLIAAPTAVPAPVPAAALAAAVDGPAWTAKDSLSVGAKAAAPDDGSTFSPRSLNTFWDGFSIPSSDVEPFSVIPAADADLLPEAAGSGARAGGIPSWLSLKDKTHAAALEAAVKLARSTRAGRRAFDGAQEALEKDGRVIPVDVRGLGRNYGEYDYLEGRLRLDRELFAPGREADLAGTLAHELVHVAQHAAGLPSNVLELEIEAHLVDLALMEELGLTPGPNTFARQAQEALAKSPKAFIALMQAAVPGSPFLGESGFDEIADQLEEDLDTQSAKKGGRAAKLAAVIAQDLRLMRSKKGRAAYREFSRRVLAELSRRSAAAR